MKPPLRREEIWETVKENQPELVEAFPTPGELSDAVIKVIVATMSGCVRDLTVRRGRHPKDYAIVAYGGAGALHVAEIAQDLGIKRVIVPAFPGLLCAYGALVADYVLDSVVTFRGALDEVDPAQLEQSVNKEIEDLTGQLEEFEGMDVTTRVFYECQFERQVHSLHVEAPVGTSTEDLINTFVADYKVQYGDLLPRTRPMVRSVRVEARSKRRGADTWSLRDAVSSSDLVPPADAAYWRPSLKVGDVIDGPNTISAVDASVTVPAGCTATVVDGGHIIIEVNE